MKAEVRRQERIDIVEERDFRRGKLLGIIKQECGQTLARVSQI